MYWMYPNSVSHCRQQHVSTAHVNIYTIHALVCCGFVLGDPYSKVHSANMGPTWVPSVPDGPMLAPWTLLSGDVTRSLQDFMIGIAATKNPSWAPVWNGVHSIRNTCSREFQNVFLLCKLHKNTRNPSQIIGNYGQGPEIIADRGWKSYYYYSDNEVTLKNRLENPIDFWR